MKGVTGNISKYIKEKGISISKISQETGVPYHYLYDSFSESKKRKLKADELLLVCDFIGKSPYDFFKPQQKIS